MVQIDISFDISNVLDEIDRTIIRTHQQRRDLMLICGMETYNDLYQRLARHRKTGELLTGLSWSSDDESATVILSDENMMTPHVGYFIRGTRPSRGRYIRQIDRRHSKTFTEMYPDRAGMHPGTPSHMYILQENHDFVVSHLQEWIARVAGM